MAKKPLVPPVPVLDRVSAWIEKAFAKVLGKQGYVDTMKKDASALGALLAKDKAAVKQVQAATEELARGLAALCTIDDVRSHSPAGFGGDYTAMRLIRAAKK